MTRLGALAQDGILQLDEVANMGFGAQLCSRTQTGKRTAVSTLTQLGAFQMAVGFDDGSPAQGGILDHAVGADLHTVLDDNLAFEDHVDVDLHIAANSHLTTQVEAGRVQQGYTLGHQAAGGALLVVALQLRQLDAVVGAQHFHFFLRGFGGHHQAIGHGHGNHVGQVVLALGIAVG